MFGDAERNTPRCSKVGLVTLQLVPCYKLIWSAFQNTGLYVKYQQVSRIENQTIELLIELAITTCLTSPWLNENS